MTLRVTVNWPQGHSTLPLLQVLDRSFLSCFCKFNWESSQFVPIHLSHSMQCAINVQLNIAFEEEIHLQSRTEKCVLVLFNSHQSEKTNANVWSFICIWGDTITEPVWKICSCPSYVRDTKSQKKKPYWFLHGIWCSNREEHKNLHPSLQVLLGSISTFFSALLCTCISSIIQCTITL